MKLGWETGTTPWIRKQEGENHLFLCYFCGATTAIISWGDERADHGRAEIYCTNSRCDAREVTILVERDGLGAGRRADVEALENIDYPRATGRSVFTARELLEIFGDKSGLLERRLGHKLT